CGTQGCRCCLVPVVFLSFFFFFPQFTLFLETVEPVVVEAESSGIFSSVWQPLLFPAEAHAADAAWIHFFPGSSHTEAFGNGAGRQAWG
ncbi:unnamed protein product, partial [Rangifer tarandus platyrhynchus]